MNSSDRKAKITALATVEPCGRKGSVKPRAMLSTAPREAPEATPMVEPSASGFRSRPCIAAPATESDAPMRAAQNTRGMRTLRRMEA